MTDRLDKAVEDCRLAVDEDEWCYSHIGQPTATEFVIRVITPILKELCGEIERNTPINHTTNWSCEHCGRPRTGRECLGCELDAAKMERDILRGALKESQRMVQQLREERDG